MEPTPDEIEAATLYWEYEVEQVSVETFADPPGSVAPVIHIRRRMVSYWEYWEEGR